MRLNGWHRIGIIASVLWLLGGGMWGNQIGLNQGKEASYLYSVCTAQADASVTDCSQHYDEEFQREVADHWLDAAIVAFVPIVCGWLLVWLILALTRWVRRGFGPTHEDVSGN